MKTPILFVMLVACGTSAEAPAKQEAAKAAPAPAVDAAAPVVSIDAAADKASGSRGPRAMFGTIPDGWSDDDEPGQMSLVVGVNESKFPVDNALFRVRYGIEDGDAPVTDPKAYVAWLEKKHSFKAISFHQVPRGHYFEAKGEFRVLLESDGVHVYCGGSLYKDGDYNKIPKVRDESVASAKKLCASVKAG
jgi:hypothetical protein